MAIKGYLSEISFVELLKIIGNYNGKLRVWNFKDGKQYECFFYNKSITYLNFCGRVVTAGEMVKEIFFELLMDGKSYYLFEDDVSLTENNSPLVSVAELLDFSIFETIEANDELLPHINTRFETVNKFDFVLQGELAGFWRDSINLLHKGCSGYDLCIELGLEERLVRQSLYKLRTTGLIKPMRMFNAANSLAKARMVKQNSGNAVKGINDVPQIHSVTNGNITGAIGDKPENGSSENIVSSQNSHSNNNHHGSQSDQFQTPPLSETVAPPDFLLKNQQPLPEPDLLVSHNHIPQVQNSSVNNSIYLQNNQPAPKTEIPETPSAFSVQISMEELSAAAHSVNFSTNSQNTANEEPQTKYESLLPPKRSNLIKRMLNSLFRG